MRELYFLNSTVTALMKKNQNKTRGVVFNSWLSRLQNKSPLLVSNNISLLKNQSVTLRHSTLSKKFAIQLLNDKKNLLLVPCKVQGVAPKAMPGEKYFPFFNRSFDKKRLKMLFSWYYANRGEAATFSLVETLQKLGFTYAMKAGISLGVDDLKVPPTKGESLTEAVELLANTKASVNSGNVTALEEFQQFVDTWHRTSENLKTSVVQNFSRSSLNFLKKSNLTGFSSLALGKTEKRKSPLLDLRSLKNKNIKSSFLEHEDLSQNKKVFSNKRQDKLLSSRKEPLEQKHKSASYSTILNPVYMMAFSGARGNLSQVRQLVGMRGLMADPQGQLVEFPIQSNFREGLTVTEYMISCYGARKGLVDTALRTAAAGYLTRRLVDVSHHQVVRFVTCSTKSGILLYKEHNKKEENRDNLLPSAWKVPPYSANWEKKTKTTGSMLYKTGEATLPLSNKSLKNSLLNKSTVFRSPLLQTTKEEKEKKAPLIFCVGRVLARDIPGYAFRNQEIDISLASSPFLRKVYDTIGIYIRSPLTCKAETGICQLCYGWSVSANRLVGLGEAVGIIAAQSIGEPGTQLTMRTFHTGGVFSGDIMEECRAKHAGVVFFQNVYLGLLVRTAGGAIAFCLKTSAIFQIKGANEITTYTVSANTLLFVRQGEKVHMDSLLAQIPNLPTVEESTGESTKTIVSDLSGEVRQKATVNAELASIRILAGQECRQFYFLNSFDLLAMQNKHNTYPMYLQKQLICTNSLYNRAQKEYKKNQFLVLSSTTNSKVKPISRISHYQRAWPKSQKLDWQNIHSPSFFQTKKTKGLVNLIWGAHRLGNNKTFAISINGSNSEVVLVSQRTIKQNTSFQKSSLYLSSGLYTNLAYATGANQAEQLTNPINIKKIKDSTGNLNYQAKKSFLEGQEFYKVKTRLVFKMPLLVDLRFFVASKIHKNKFHSPLLKKNSSVVGLTGHLLINNFTRLSQVTLCMPSKASQNTKKNAMLLKHSQKPKLKNQLKLKDFFVGSYTPKHIQLRLWPLDIPFGPGTLKHFKNNRFHWLSAELIQTKILLDKGSRSTFQLYKNTVKLLDKKKTNGAIKKISTLTVWPELTPPKILDYAYLFWKLEDLLFFRSNLTKKTQVFSQLRISINQRWWGNKSSNSLYGQKIIIKTKSKGLELMNSINESKKRPVIKEFPNLILQLFSRFNIEKCLSNQPVPLQTEKPSHPFRLPFNAFNSDSKPRLKFQDSGEIFPLQGNTNLVEFQKKFRSFQNATGLNSGLLIHYNRISYKIPLCYAITNAPLFVAKTSNLSLTKERLSFLRSELSVFALQNLQSKSNSILFSRTVLAKNPLVPKIGDFINTGDEIIKECASAYCGQIIEKSPVGLTLRLTQNILYSNLRNRPAKINKSVKNGHWIGKGAPLVALPYISNVTGDIVAGIPKIEQLFEARGEALDETVEKIWTSTKLSILPRSKAVRECFKEIGLFVVAAIQKVYSSQGVYIADKHLEVIIRQMTRRALIVDPGDTEFLPEEFVDLNTIECVNWATYGDNATYRPRLIGITKASLTSNSFLSSASFQQTARVLERETVLEKTDRLLGLKERVMMGALINAGTGELKTSVRLSDRSLSKSLSNKLFQRLNFFSRRKIEINQKKFIAYQGA